MALGLPQLLLPLLGSHIVVSCAHLVRRSLAKSPAHLHLVREACSAGVFSMDHS